MPSWYKGSILHLNTVGPRLNLPIQKVLRCQKWLKRKMPKALLRESSLFVGMQEGYKFRSLDHFLNLSNNSNLMCIVVVGLVVKLDASCWMKEEDIRRLHLHISERAVANHNSYDLISGKNVLGTNTYKVCIYRVASWSLLQYILL